VTAEDDVFRKSMRLLAGGVTIVTSAFEDCRSGLTATAVCSLALTPPRILASINVRGDTFGIVRRSRCMSVNLLSVEHERLACRFATQRAMLNEDRFSAGDWVVRRTGAPLLADALAALDCHVTDIIPLDTHALLIGLVEDIIFGPPRPPLIHFESQYTSVLGAIPEQLARTPARQ
jgi:flavin reductase (DIM6/NTAB) family NADH-FMN oxidoreductase RutF